MRSTPLAGVDRRLQRDAVQGLALKEAAGRDVFALGILADHDQVDFLRLPVGQRRPHAGKQLGRADVGVLVEALPHFDQRPYRLMVGHVRRIAQGAEIDGVKPAELLQIVVRNALAGLFPIPGSPVEFRQRQLKPAAR